MATADKLVNLADLKAAYDTTVRHDAAQTLTAAQQRTARDNIGAVGSDETDALGAATSLSITSWAQGTISSLNGTNANSSTRIRTSAYYKMTADTVVCVELAAGYEIGLREYTAAAGDYVKAIPGSDAGYWAAGGIRAIVPTGHYLRFVVRRSDDSDITTEDAENVAVVKLTGVAADLAPVETATASAAHAVGDLMVLGGVLYRVTQGIAVGDVIAPGTNVSGTTVSAEMADRSVTVSGSTPSITALAGIRYVCTAASITELSFTPPASGVCSVRFKAGQSMVNPVFTGATMPDWWTGVESGRTYEVSFADRLGVVTSWA